VTKFLSQAGYLRTKPQAPLLVVLEKQDIETEMIQFSGQKVLPFLICKVKNNTLSDMGLSMGDTGLEPVTSCV
jgi:hypothetical protein